jgi:hypothetical protein
MKKPTKAEIEKQKVHRALEGKPQVAPISVPEEKPAEAHKETDAERRERWNNTWGDSFSDADCRKMDYIHDMISQEYRGVDSPRIQLNLIKLAKLNFLQDKAIDAGEADLVKQYTTSIKEIQAMEGMRATDQKPVEALRPDALIDRLEKKGVSLMSQEEVARYINGDKGKYKTSIDVVDFIMMKWINTFRTNNGESELGLLPKSLQVEDVYGELQPRLTKKEADTLAELEEITPAREK